MATENFEYVQNPFVRVSDESNDCFESMTLGRSLLANQIYEQEVVIKSLLLT